MLVSLQQPKHTAHSSDDRPWRPVWWSRHERKLRQRSGYSKGDSIAAAVTRQMACGGSDAVAAGLSFEIHHGGGGAGNASLAPRREDDAPPEFMPCAASLADHTPCHDQERAMTFPRKNMVYREWHCPPDSKRLRCLVPAPPGYVTPFLWPKSRDYVPFAKAPYKSLTVEKAVQNWVQYEGTVFRFPGGGTQFPRALTMATFVRCA